MRRRIRWGLCMLLSAAVLASCSNEIPESKPGTRKGRTVLAYLVANNNLNTYLEDNVMWMYEALSAMTDTCTLLVYYRPRPNDATFEGPTLMEFVSDGKGNVNGIPALTGSDVSFDAVVEAADKKVYSDDGSYVSVDPMAMRQVLLDMQEIAPSESYGLIFGSHATSWIEGRSVRSKSFGDDGGYNIDIPDMAEVLRSSFPEKLDFILFDACMMGTAEVAYEFRDVTDYLIGSVMETPVEGFPYKKVLPRLYGGASGFAQVCGDFVSFNRENGVWGTCALLDCTKAENLANVVKNELGICMSEPYDLDYNDVYQYGLTQFEYFSFDIGDFFRILNGGQMPESIRLMLDEVVVAKKSVSGRYSSTIFIDIDEDRFCGIGMYLPDCGIRDSWDEYYRTSISWYQAAGWERFAPSASAE